MSLSIHLRARPPDRAVCLIPGLTFLRPLLLLFRRRRTMLYQHRHIHVCVVQQCVLTLHRPCPAGESPHPPLSLTKRTFLPLAGHLASVDYISAAKKKTFPPPRRWFGWRPLKGGGGKEKKIEMRERRWLCQEPRSDGGRNGRRRVHVATVGRIRGMGFTKWSSKKAVHHSVKV